MELYQLPAPAQELFKENAKKPHILRNESRNIIQQYHVAGCTGTYETIGPNSGIILICLDSKTRPL